MAFQIEIWQDKTFRFMTNRQGNVRQTLLTRRSAWVRGLTRPFLAGFSFPHLGPDGPRKGEDDE
jgi:hypothetical protein